jgi:hypothetical protein
MVINDMEDKVGMSDKEAKVAIDVKGSVVVALTLQ